MEATKLTIYLGRTERIYRVPAFVAACDLLRRRGVAGATVLLGVDGTAHGQRQRAAFFSSNAETPVMVIAVGSGDRIGRVLPEPIHRAIIRRLREAGINGATTQRGIWGFHGDHRPHGDRLLQLGRHVPAVTIVIDTPERIGTAYSVIDELTAKQGLVTSESVTAIRSASATVRGEED